MKIVMSYMRHAAWADRWYNDVAKAVPEGIEAQVGFILDSPGVDQDFMEYSRQSGFVHQLWTDCYLAAVARFKNCRVVSFDRDFHRFPNLAFLELGS